MGHRASVNGVYKSIFPLSRLTFASVEIEKRLRYETNDLIFIFVVAFPVERLVRSNDPGKSDRCGDAGSVAIRACRVVASGGLVVRVGYGRGRGWCFLLGFTRGAFIGAGLAGRL